MTKHDALGKKGFFPLLAFFLLYSKSAKALASCYSSASLLFLCYSFPSIAVFNIT